MDNVPKETHVVSVMTSRPLETVARDRDEKDDRLLLHQIQRQNRLTARDKKSSQGSGSKQENSSDKSEIPCRFNSAKIRHTSLKKDVYMATNAISDMLRQKESLAKSQRKVVRKDQLRF